MSDVNNNPLHPSSLQANEPRKKQSPKVVTESENLPVIENLDNSPQAFLGRTQVKKVSINELNLESELAKNIKKDVETFKGNQKLVEKSDFLFEKMMDECVDNGDCNAYQKAVKQQLEFVEELKN